MSTNKRSDFSILFALLTLIIAFAGLGFAIYYFFEHKDQVLFSTPTKATTDVFLENDLNPTPAATSFGNIPAWLFMHVAVIAAFQVLAVLWAAMKARSSLLSSRDLAVIQFLIEIPMYLGLFGTLLGVCLTQFVSGTLVAPLAYMTTMTGILLHVFGKLTIWLALASDEHGDD